ncbi:nucleotidyl transferase AbiEii/AbiGii toxin family protein [Natranaerovirga hydrolytica]|uniref:nucleotidyl transferase AbiEii/AbiGii toxin family protein n=1 Tax=Natranaerovirga hydrolytica TaxID=680378 RepID=UPI001A9AAB0D|nr:nucleotidyl transferase AbiEii/AbiGii toxin family protein [Natranaerovirga hydrolytica]
MNEETNNKLMQIEVRGVKRISELIANTVLQNFIIERLLERISISKYKDTFILKGGFLIAAMVG